MLLRMLRERGGASTLPPGYQLRPIRALVDVDSTGRFRGFTENSDSTAARGQRLPVPSLKRTSGDRPILLADGPDYLFGLSERGDATQREKARRRRDLHLGILEHCVDATGSALARAALAFFREVSRDEDLRHTIAAAVAEYPGDLAVRVADELVTDAPEVQRFWAAEIGLGAAAPGDSPCSVCGGQVRIPEMWPVSIKGLPGGQTSGTQLVSMNKDAFESYGQKRATAATVCAPCGERIANALNTLLADDRHRFTLGNVVYVTWHTGDEAFELFHLLQNPQPELVQRIVASPFTAQADFLRAQTGDLVTLVLSASASRVVVHEWDVVPVPVLRERLGAYFVAQGVVGSWGEETMPVTLRALALSTARDRKDLAPSTSLALLRAILLGRAPAASVAALVVRRIVVEDAPKVTRPQAALLTWFLSLSQEGLVVPHALDPALDRAAYHWGRALAEIDAIQRAALGKGVGATVVDRYFGAASSRPATVFGMLIEGAQHHLGKLKRSNEPAALALNRRLEEILDRLRAEALPTTLALADQTLFCLGFYHQRADDRRAAAAHGRHDGGSPLATVLGPALEEETA